MTTLSRAVFRSYASEDAAPAQPIGEALCAAGIEDRFDKSELRGGDKRDQMIRRTHILYALFVDPLPHWVQRRELR